jgi:DNA topoisomerase-1
MVVAANGRFGPYVKCGAETRSLSAELSPLDITLAQALELLAQPKAQRRGFGAKREPLRVLEVSPVTGQPIQLLEGRYGPYLNDGVTNASLPKQSDPAAVTLAEALDLLAARAAAGPPAKKKFRRASGKAAPAASAKKKVKKKAAKDVGGEVLNAVAAGTKPVAGKDAPKKGAKKSAKKPAAKRAVGKKAASASEA